MKQGDLEAVFEALALAIDEVGKEQSEIYLAKVVLALADDLDDVAHSQKVIEECKTGLI